MSASINVGMQSLLGYLPAIIIQKILDGQIDTKNFPAYHKINTVSLFADISGFTKLSESFSKKGRIGPEFLAFSLNRYMEQLINIIGKNGGDIFKFAGDAILVVWPPNDNIVESCQRAIQCALDIQEKLNDQEISPNKRLSVKIGIGVGECTILVVGGVFGRCEYLSVGDALAQACESETKASAGGETICSQDVYKYVKGKFEVVEAVGPDNHGHESSENEMKFYKILKMTSERLQIKADAYLMRTKFSLDKLREKLSVLKAFVPNAIIKYLDIEKEIWSKEIRMMSSMFLNLKVDLKQTKTDQGIQRIQKIVKTVQRCVYRTKGALNKFLMDDKGSVMVICWGLPPLSNSDDHVRAVLCGTTMIEELRKLKCGAFMGVSSGTCFTGVCGTVGGRREYSLLGEIVNLSARHMQKAICYAKDLEKVKNNKIEFVQLIDEKTKCLIQNKIFANYVCKDFLKGFQFEFDFYEPLLDDRSTFDFHKNLFPEIKTHKDNVPLYNLPPSIIIDQKKILKKSLFMFGRKAELEICESILNSVHKNGNIEAILIRGVMGSGKSLFVRKLLYNFLENNKVLKSKALQFSLNYPFVFVSYQMPTTYLSPFNGWKTIFKQIYRIYHEEYIIKHKIEFINYELDEGYEKFTIKLDLIGKILFKLMSFNCIRYIEEILEVDLFKHIIIPENIKEQFFEYYPIIELPEIDPFFECRKFNQNELKIQEFFVELIKKYKKFLDTFHNQNLQYSYPLIFVLEDTQHIDGISTNFIDSLKKKIHSICIICTYQDQLYLNESRDPDNFIKSLDIFDEDKVFFMVNINEVSENNEMIKTYLEGKLEIDKIDTELLNIILPMSFKGVPLFTFEIVDSLIDSKIFLQHLQQELIATPELQEMHNNRDWSNFVIPLKMEKLIGSFIDYLDFKEIIILKMAAAIGNIFDLNKLYKLYPFNLFTIDDMYSILSKMESNGILEFLYDFKPKKLICKFSIPFYRDILYQRMLIEQRNDIHLNVARIMQYTKFSYLPANVEVDYLKYHLKKTEKSIINYMEEEENELIINNNKIKFSTNNNQKIILVKEVIQKLKSIYLKFEEGDIKNKNGLIYNGILLKKSDSNFTWEKRYIVMTNKKFYFYYRDKDYRLNKEPLGYFEIKNLYKLEILPDYSIIGVGSKKNIFEISVSQWNKKDSIQIGRTFYFSTETKDKLTEWITQINFLRIKETYDYFSSTYGLINLPLPHEGPDQGKKKIKSKLKNNLLSTIKSNKTSVEFYNSLARRSISINYNDNHENDKIKKNSKILPRTSLIPKNLTDQLAEEIDNVIKIKKSKENLVISFSLAFICIFAFTQDIIFNVEKVGLREDMTISVSNSLRDYINENYDFTTTTNQKSVSKTNLQSPEIELINKDKIRKNNTINFISEQKLKDPEVMEDKIEEKLKKSKTILNKIDFTNSTKNYNKKEKDIINFEEQIKISEKEKDMIIDKDRQKEIEIVKNGEIEKHFEIERQNNYKEVFINLDCIVKKSDATKIIIPDKNNENYIKNNLNNNIKKDINYLGNDSKILTLIDMNTPEMTESFQNNNEINLKARSESRVKISLKEVNDNNETDSMSNLKVVNNPSNEILYDKIEKTNPVEPHFKTNIFYKLSSQIKSDSNLFINNSPPQVENNKFNLNDETNLDKLSLNQPDSKSLTNLLPSFELTHNKNEKLSNNLSTKFKNLNIIKEDLDDLFYNKDEDLENAETKFLKESMGKPLKKKKNNSIINDLKYKDIKTKEKFNLYASNIFAKKN